ncbi:MAG TPA: methyltransferase domain-containing protein [Actinoplanes sp.]|nr:methyltransferase domain-containing protein [Actinoplanes sp.]
MEIDPEVSAHYAAGEEHGRLTARPSLELVRTRVLLERFLPPAPARVLDVGGGAGVHASWLAERGHRVRLVDPVALHVTQARAAGGFEAVEGDARDLDEPDASYDAVLLLGPLYHLVAYEDRVRALREAARVARPGAVIVAAAISRYASTFEGYFRNLVDRPGFAAVMAQDLSTGQHRNPDRVPEFFTTAYFHTPAGLTAEMERAGLRPKTVLPVEGPLHWAPDLERRLTDPVQRRLLLDVLATLERDPAVTAATAHLLAIARR